MSEQSIQEAQRKRYEDWVSSEGGVERRVTEATYKEPAQLARTAWLVENTRDVPLLLNGYKDIIELGVSGGHQLIAVNGMAGVDINPKIIDEDRQLYPQRIWRVADVTVYLPFDSGKFHTVLVPEILEHVWFNEALQAVREAKRVSKSRVLITIPSALVPEKNQRNWAVMKHRWACTASKLTELLSVCEDYEWQYECHSDEAFIYIRIDKRMSV